MRNGRPIVKKRTCRRDGPEEPKEGAVIKTLTV
jgi:hypothetical protein